MIIIKTLNEARIEKNLTLKEISRILEISECYCSLLLSGKRRMSLDNAEKLSKILGSTIDEVYRLYKYTQAGSDAS